MTGDTTRPAADPGAAFALQVKTDGIWWTQWGETGQYLWPATPEGRAEAKLRAARAVFEARVVLLAPLDSGPVDRSTRGEESLPSAPCRACGPGYRIGDDGCRHDPYEPDEGEIGICRTCAEPIWWESGTVGHREQTGWSDRNERGGDSVVCFKAADYRHVPMGSREAAIYRAGVKAGRAEAREHPEGSETA